MMQDGEFKAVHVLHLKDGMSRVELVPLHLPIPKLASHPHLIRAEVMITDIDLLQLSAGVRVLEIEAKSETAKEILIDTVTEVEESENNPEEDASSN